MQKNLESSEQKNKDYFKKIQECQKKIKELQEKGEEKMDMTTLKKECETYQEKIELLEDVRSDLIEKLNKLMELTRRSIHIHESKDNNQIQQAIELARHATGRAEALFKQNASGLTVARKFADRLQSLSPVPHKRTLPSSSSLIEVSDISNQPVSSEKEMNLSSRPLKIPRTDKKNEPAQQEKVLG